MTVWRVVRTSGDAPASALPVVRWCRGTRRPRASGLLEARGPCSPLQPAATTGTHTDRVRRDGRVRTEMERRTVYSPGIDSGLWSFGKSIDDHFDVVCVKG